MVITKIINNTDRPISLNWMRGGISIPVKSAAIVEFDPFSLMDRNGSVFKEALYLLEKNIVSVEYFAVPPCRMITSLDIPSEVKPEVKKQEPAKQHIPFDSKESYHKNDFQANVANMSAPAKQEDAPAVEVSVFGMKQAVEQPTEQSVEPTAPTEESTADATATEGRKSRRSKKF